MTREIKVGDIVHYTYSEDRPFCKVQEIEGNRLWGLWVRTIEEAEQTQIQDRYECEDRMLHLNIGNESLKRITKTWKERLQ